MSSFTTSRFPAFSISRAGLGDTEALSTDPAQLVESPDESLMALVQIGDLDALALLFRRFACPVRNVGQRILRHTAEADDLVQEVFLYIQRRSKLFDRSKGSVRSWIFQLAYTQALMRRRQLKSHGFYASPITDKTLDNSSCGTKGTPH